MMTKEAKTRPQKGRKTATLGRVGRDTSGNVTMIDFMEYIANKEAPAIYVNAPGGVYKIADNTVQVVFVIRLHDPDTGLEHRQVVSLIWDEKDWLATRRYFQAAMVEWERTKRGDGKSRKRVMQAGMH